MVVIGLVDLVAPDLRPVAAVVPVWLSRPASDIGRVFGGRPVGVIGATPGRAGTRLSQTAWLSVFRTLGLVRGNTIRARHLGRDIEDARQAPFRI